MPDRTPFDIQIPDTGPEQGSSAPLGEEQIRLDEILAEYHYNEVISSTGRRKKGSNRKKSAQVDEPLDEGTQKLKHLVEEMRAFTRNQEQAVQDPAPEPSVAEDKPPVPVAKEKRRRGKKKRPAAGEDTPDIQIDAAFAPPGAELELLNDIAATVGEELQKELYAAQLDVSEDTFGHMFAPATEPPPLEWQEEPQQDEENEGQEDRPYVPFAQRIRRLLPRKEQAEQPQAGVSVERAAQALLPYVRLFSIRVWAALIVCVPLVYITLSHWFGWQTPDFATYLLRPRSYLLVQLLLLLLVMLCAIDILAKGLKALASLKPGMFSMVLLTCVSNVIYVVYMLLQKEFAVIYLPYCSVAAVTLLFALMGERERYRAYQRTYKTASIAQKPILLRREENLFEEGPVFVKEPGDMDLFVAQTEQEDGAARFSRFLTPVFIVGAFLFAAIASIGAGKPSHFLWALCALFSAATPFMAFMAFALPYAKATRRLSAKGAALSGWLGAHTAAQDGFAVLTDGDLFPSGMMHLNGLKVFGSHSFDRVISYVAAMAKASGSQLGEFFNDMLRDQIRNVPSVTEFQHYENGGVGGEIQRNRVLMGSASFMLRMGIRLPEELPAKNAVFIAINLDLAGVFALHYVAADSVRNNLLTLLRNQFAPVLAVRDFNINPTFVRGKFKLEYHLHDQLAVQDRILLSEAEGRAKPMAACAVPGLTPYAESLCAGRRVAKLTKINMILYLIFSLVGLGVMFYFVLKGDGAAASAASPGNLLVFSGLCALPTLLLSGFAHRY